MRVEEERMQRSPPMKRGGSTAPRRSHCQEWGISKPATFPRKEGAKVLRNISQHLFTPTMVEIMEGHGLAEVGNLDCLYLI